MKKFLMSAVPFVLGAALLTVGILYTEERRTNEGLLAENAALLQQRQSDAENAARAFSNALNDMQSNLRKLHAAGGREQHARLLGEVRRLSDAASGALERLSVSHTDGKDLAGFLTRTGDYAATLLEAVNGGRMPTETDRSQLGEIRKECAALQKRIEERIASGQLPVEPITTESYYTASEQTDAVPAYPSLLYDGPFSESSENAEPLGLPNETITEAQAKTIAAEAVLKVDWQYDGRCASQIATYDFSGGNGESLSVTERGGKVLYWMTPPVGDKADPPTDAESERMHAVARTYLAQNGFGKMHPSYAQYYAGSVVINYAAVQGGVVLYGDLIKVYVDRERAEVIGFDARNYYSHHHERELPIPTLREEDAKNAVSTDMTLEAVTLCLIPKSNVKEVLCYECKGTVGERFFLVYINALTGVEEEIFEIINTEEGDLVV